VIAPPISTPRRSSTPSQLDELDLAIEHHARQTVLGDPEAHHAARDRGRVEDDDLVPHEREIVAAGEARGPCAHDGDPARLLGARARALDAGQDPIERSGLDAVPLVDHALERPDLQRGIDGRSAARGLARVRADPPAHRCERVRPPRERVRLLEPALRDERHVPARVAPHGAGAPAREVGGQELQIHWSVALPVAVRGHGTPFVQAPHRRRRQGGVAATATLAPPRRIAARVAGARGVGPSR
jgi:hypothetical protein